MQMLKKTMSFFLLGTRLSANCDGDEHDQEDLPDAHAFIEDLFERIGTDSAEEMTLGGKLRFTNSLIFLVWPYFSMSRIF